MMKHVVALTFFKHLKKKFCYLKLKLLPLIFRFSARAVYIISNNKYEIITVIAHASTFLLKLSHILSVHPVSVSWYEAFNIFTILLTSSF